MGWIEVGWEVVQIAALVYTWITIRGLQRWLKMHTQELNYAMSQIDQRLEDLEIR